MFEQAVELINEHRVSLPVLAVRRGTLNTEVDRLLGHNHRDTGEFEGRVVKREGDGE